MNLARIFPMLALCLVVQAQASVSLNGTRLIMQAGGDVSIEARNRGDQPVLLQAWLAAPDEDAQALNPQVLPFVVTPALARLPGQGRHLLRVLYQGSGMPAGRESLVHLYVLEIPRRHAGAQQLSIAVRQRINLFYRPAGLPGEPAEAAGQLRWSLEPGPEGGGQLRVSNPTAFHVSLLDLQLDGQALRDYLLLPPFQDFQWPLAQSQPKQLRFKALNDYGGQRGYCAQATGQAAFSARLVDHSLMAGGC